MDKMQAKQKYRGLQTPKLTPITKQQYRKFYFIRKLHSESLGQYELLSHNQKKYIGKDLPVSCSFMTLRSCCSQPVNSPSNPIYHYSEQGCNKYIFQLSGEPLCDIWRARQGPQIRDWVARCGNFQNAMLELIRFCVRMYQQNGIEDLIAECFRVWDGKVWYCYDSWMKPSLDIVAQNNLDIQNYFLSQNQLTFLSNKNKYNQTAVPITYKDYLYKLALFVLSLILPEVKIRNYQYCQYSLNKTNIEQKLKIFKIKTSNKQLQDLVTKFLNQQIQTMDQVWKIMAGSKLGRGESPSIYSAASGCKNKSVPKTAQQKQNSLVTNQKQKSHNRKASTATKPDLGLQKCQNNQRKIKLRGRSGAINQSINYSCSNINPLQYQQSEPTEKAHLNFKQLFSKPPPNSCMKMLEYLGLTEEITQSLYEKSIINALEGLRVKAEWGHKIYANGSIYLGEIHADRREGMGIYLFDSQDLYVGNWVENSMHGFGTYVFRSGEVYKGELRRGLKHGFGRFQYKDGRVYEGHWQDNIKIGFGSVKFPNGTNFIGFFNKSNETNGLFTTICNNELVEYASTLQSYNPISNTFPTVSLSHPLLKSKLKKCHTQCYIPFLRDEGVRYYGEYSQGQPNGYGIKESEKELYEGGWKQGKQHGDGRLVVKGKWEIQGNWADGIIVRYNLK